MGRQRRGHRCKPDCERHVKNVTIKDDNIASLLSTKTSERLFTKAWGTTHDSIVRPRKSMRPRTAIPKNNPKTRITTYRIRDRNQSILWAI